MEAAFHATPTTLADTSGKVRRSERACDRCRASKIRCDRTTRTAPCTRCTRQGIACLTHGVSSDPVVTVARPLSPGSNHNARRACDRCKAGKSRCERSDLDKPCDRCAKARIDCVTSPSLPMGRRPKIPINGAPPLESNDADQSADLDMPLLLPTLAGYVGMDHGWSEAQALNNGQPTESQVNYLTKLGNLQREVLLDVDMVKNCKSIEKCPEASLPLEFGYNASFPLGRMLEHSKSLLELLDSLNRPAPAVNGSHMPSANGRLAGVTCDAPTIFSLLSCYVCLVRIYRTNLSSIHDSMPMLLSLQNPVPQLLPGINMGGFSLESRLDLQVLFLVQTCEDMISRLEARLGVGESESGLSGKCMLEPAQVKMLAAMLEAEANEQPPLHEPRGHCKPLKHILVDLKQIVQAHRREK
jgi:hypothetical protein